MAIVRVRNNQSGDISHIGEEWLERWPEDFTLAPEVPEPTADSAPAPSEKPSKPKGAASEHSADSA